MDWPLVPSSGNGEKQQSFLTRILNKKTYVTGDPLLTPTRQQVGHARAVDICSITATGKVPRKIKENRTANTSAKEKALRDPSESEAS
jgi:hypothetical protein